MTRRLVFTGGGYGLCILLGAALAIGGLRWWETVRKEHTSAGASAETSRLNKSGQTPPGMKPQRNSPFYAAGEFNGPPPFGPTAGENPSLSKTQWFNDRNAKPHNPFADHSAKGSAADPDLVVLPHVTEPLNMFPSAAVSGRGSEPPAELTTPPQAAPLHASTKADDANPARRPPLMTQRDPALTPNPGNSARSDTGTGSGINSDSPPKSMAVTRPADHSGLEKLIREQLPEATAEELRIWRDELQALPEEMARDILRLRKNLDPLRSLRPSPTTGLPPLARDSVGETLPPLPIPDENGPVLPPFARRLPLPEHGRSFQTLPTPDDRSRLLASIKWQHCRSARAIVLEDLANAETTGYRRREFLWPTVKVTTPNPETVPVNSVMLSPAAAATEAGIQGVQHPALRTRLVTTPGELQKTGRSLDIAVDGAGWLAVLAGKDVVFTRCGRLILLPGGMLGVDLGEQSLPLAQRVKIPAIAISIRITPAGNVVVEVPGEAEPLDIGQLSLAVFLDDSQLQPSTDGTCQVSMASGSPHSVIPGTHGSGELLAGTLERSNVEIETARRQLADLEADAAWWQAEMQRETDIRPLPMARKPADHTARTDSLKTPATRQILPWNPAALQRKLQAVRTKPVSAEFPRRPAIAEKAGR